MRLQALESVIQNGLRVRLMEPELLKMFCAEFHREVNRLRIEGNAGFEARRGELDRVECRMRRIVD
jgi:site-specific DNA recombinase